MREGRKVFLFFRLIRFGWCDVFVRQAPYSNLARAGCMKRRVVHAADGRETQRTSFSLKREKKKRKERKEIFQQLANVFMFSFAIMRKVLIWKEIESSRDILSRRWMNENLCWKLKQSYCGNLLRRCKDSIIDTCDVVDWSFCFHFGESVTCPYVPQADQPATAAREKYVRIDCHARDPTFVRIVHRLLQLPVS